MDHVNPESSYVTTASADKPRRYSDEFKRDAVRLITEERYKSKAAARAVGVSEKSLRDWHKKLAPPPHACGDDTSVDELREENKRLRKATQAGRVGTRNPKKSHGVFAKESQSPFVDKRDAWIKEHRESFRVAVMCDVLRVSPSGYYARHDRAPSERAMRHERIKQSVAAVHAESHGVYGSLQGVADQLQKTRRSGIGLPQYGGGGHAGNGPEKPVPGNVSGDGHPGVPSDAGASDQSTKLSA